MNDQDNAINPKYHELFVIYEKMLGDFKNLLQIQIIKNDQFCIRAK